jgi:hypothetical protein
MDIAATVIELLCRRDADASICPSDVARALASDEAAWRALMAPVRNTAAAMARRGSIVITQGANTVKPDDIEHGPVRLRRGPRFGEG